jgi:glycosyltransferase involved in cell wall biosynthesis
MGEFDRDAVSTTYAAIDVIVVPSIWPENSPLVVHEAFMAGVPVVAARTGGLAELVADGVNGLLYEPRSVAELTAALQTILDDPSRLEAFADRIPPVKSMSVHAAEWESIYFGLLGTRD